MNPHYFIVKQPFTEEAKTFSIPDTSPWLHCNEANVFDAIFDNYLNAYHKAVDMLVDHMKNRWNQRIESLDNIKLCISFNDASMQSVWDYDGQEHLHRDKREENYMENLVEVFKNHPASLTPEENALMTYGVNNTVLYYDNNNIQEPEEMTRRSLILIERTYMRTDSWNSTDQTLLLAMNRANELLRYNLGLRHQDEIDKRTKAKEQNLKEVQGYVDAV